ncbi:MULTISPECIES: DUF3427 domain-containing protein [Pontibacillus]|uniref:DEAD/DEAH box helicase n=1 Tax=Pontibacillus chungwhensis TaxID=265426 RepID=A0ABY8UZZ2_9BACI|nr:DEAD/DEAH box helicase [Pontibacillus chungwhensis]MCD5324450.1 DEAD/DEAH box helicase [Pontibacillus sp. HN14]WIF99255.1 DEAD/DEAH box helicase [Pontibacillus chungwhensis]
MGDIVRNLEDSLHRSFIDHRHRYSEMYSPKLLVNRSPGGETVLSSILEEIEHCHSFIFSVAFITESGLATLKSQLLDLHSKGIKGKILTSTFLQFNKPKVFRELLKLKNVEVRLTSLPGFHSKGYIFEHENYHSLIVGSSNLTAHALKVNYEWNIKLTSHENGEIIHHFNNQFDEVWKESVPLNEDWINRYEIDYLANLDRPAEQIQEMPGAYEINPVKEAIEIEPNNMQVPALQAIQRLREEGEEKGIVVSATGTGKTYLSAFDVRRYAPKKMLFIVHREQILRKAMADFRRVLGGEEEDFGILSGTSKDTSARYLFATIQTISKDDVLSQFEEKEFDYILIDEVHKAGATSYKKVMEYFKPEFLLGMTATPERTDGVNIYELFDYNLAYEIRLQEALEEDMLCPFHYFGVTDYETHGELVDDTTQLANLVDEERVEHILEKVDYYGHSGEKVRGLIFCSRKEEAHQLSRLMNQKGLKAVALTGDDDSAKRLQTVDDLENGLLDYILTVDIFNEGIDIPSINQVIMLRQTQSSIIFVQQLGRGLRKHNSKEFVSVIDFIGNYKNNYLIPIALSGDKSQNKDNIRRHLKEKNFLNGVSTINFEEIAKKQIYKAIDDSKLNDMRVLKDEYKHLKNKIGRIPYLLDFMKFGSIDPEVIMEKNKNYMEFLKRVEKDIGTLNDYKTSILNFLSQEVLDGKRKHEVLLLTMLIEHGDCTITEYERILEEAGLSFSASMKRHLQRIMNLKFFTMTDQKKYGNEPIATFEDNQIVLNPAISTSLAEDDFFSGMVRDVLEVAGRKNSEYKNPLTLYKKYTRKDVCKLLNWDNDEQGTMFGYKPKHNTCPIFVTYHKGEDVESSVNYEDELINRDTLRWFTRSNRTLQSKEVQEIINAPEKGAEIHIFIKKDDDEGKGFYYFGKATPNMESIQENKMIDAKGKEIPVVKMDMILENTVDYQLYHYLKDA